MWRRNRFSADERRALMARLSERLPDEAAILLDLQLSITPAMTWCETNYSNAV